MRLTLRVQKLLIAADCTAYAYANFHQEFMRGKVTLIGCPKLDAVDYSEKLTEILRSNDIQSVTILRMEVPCCGGLEMAAKKALQTSGKFIPWQVVTISIDGKNSGLKAQGRPIPPFNALRISCLAVKYHRFHKRAT